MSIQFNDAHGGKNAEKKGISLLTCQNLSVRLSWAWLGGKVWPRHTMKLPPWSLTDWGTLPTQDDRKVCYGGEKNIASNKNLKTKSINHGNPKPSFLGVINPYIQGFKTFIFHGFGVQGNILIWCVRNGIFESSLGSPPLVAFHSSSCLYQMIMDKDSLMTNQKNILKIIVCSLNFDFLKSVNMVLLCVCVCVQKKREK